MNFLFYVEVLSIILETILLKVFLSINQRKLVFKAKIDADLGEEYNSASSPKPSP